MNNIKNYIKNNVVTDVLKNIFKNYYQTCRKNLSKFAILIQIIVPVVLSMCNMSIACKLLLSCVFLFLCRVIREVSDKINHRCFDGLPVPHERFTHVDTNGFTEFTCDSMQEVLMYMTELEEYFERKGLMK